MSNIALIPARSGSKRVPNKNIRILENDPLIAHTIKPAIESRLFSKVIVITDSEDYAKISRSYGAEIPAVITVIRVDLDLIIGTIMAIKVSGIMNCKSKNSGKSLPIKTPNNVEICQDTNNVIPEPKR